MRITIISQLLNACVETCTCETTLLVKAGTFTNVTVLIMTVYHSLFNDQ